MSIVLYTQPRCTYCNIMKEKLDRTGYTYYTINIQEDPKALAFMKERGHRTVPQLYAYDKHLNKKNTQDYSVDELSNMIKEAMENWPWQDSGIEQGI
jgi:glutaredoxin